MLTINEHNAFAHSSGFFRSRRCEGRGSDEHTLSCLVAVKAPKKLTDCARAYTLGCGVAFGLNVDTIQAQ